MSGDFDDDDDEFGGDDLFSHPDLLASVEKVEQEHKNVVVNKEHKPVVTAGSGRNGGGGYHHTVARPAMGARARGRAPQNHSSARPTTSHLAPQPQPRPQPAPVHQQPLPQPLVQAQPPRLALKPAPIPEETSDDDDDYAMSVGVFVDDNGGYQLVNQSEDQAQQPAPAASEPRPIANLPRPTSPAPLSSERKALGRSASLNFDSSSIQRRDTANRPAQAHSSQGFGGSQAGPQRQWKRNSSADMLARAQAIEKAVGSGSMSHAAVPVAARPVVNFSRPPAAALSTTTATPRKTGADDENAKLQAEIERLRAAMRQTELKAEEEVLTYKREAQKRQGETIGVRKRLEEITKKSEETISELKQEKLSAQEEAKRLQAEHKKQLDSVQSQHTFDVHNNKAHKFFPSQKTAGPAGFGRTTPARGSSQFPGAAMPFQTPSRSPGRSQRSPRTNRKWQAELMPPPPPPAFVDPNRFKTPGRTGTSQRKGKLPLEGRPPVASPSFATLQDSFSVNPEAVADRLSKRAKQMHTPSQLPVFGDDDTRDAGRLSPDEGGFGLDMDPMPYQKPAEVDESDQFQIERSDADLRGEVIHVLFEHSYVPANGPPERPRITTIQRLLNIQTIDVLLDPEQDAYDDACAGLWDAIGDNRLSANETCALLVENLVEAAIILCRANVTLPMVAVMRLIVYMAHSLSLFGDVQERFARYIPGDQLVLIAKRCKQISPIKPSMPLAAQNTSLRPAVSRMPKTASLGDKTLEVYDKPTVELVEIGRALIAFASVLGMDFSPPSEVLSTFVSDLNGLQSLMQPDQPLDLVLDAVDLALSVSSCKYHHGFFRQLLVLKSEESRDVQRPPLVELLCGYLRTRHREANDATTNILQLRVLCIFSTMCSVEADALTLLGNSYFLVPTLISYLVDQSERIWGVATSPETTEDALRLLVPALSLLHHLIFPPAFGPDIHDPSTPGRNGVNLMERLAELLKSRDFGSLHHSFYTALPRITYAGIGEDIDGWDPAELRNMQDLAQDILEDLVDAPEEGDGMFEVYRSIADDPADPPDDQSVEIIESMGIDPGLEDETEARNLASPMDDLEQAK